MTESGRKKKRRLFKPIIAISLCAAFVICALCLFASRSLGAFNESKAVLFSVYKTSNTIENGTLFIGTWLIHKDSLTDDYYEKAKSSASDSGQDVKYYKSELADGSWFDISGAESLSDISKGATPTDESELDPLYVEFVVGSDGKLHDANGGDVNPYNNPDPYDLRRLDELRPVWFQYALDSSTEKNVTESVYLEDHNSKAKDREESDKYLYQKVTSFWSSNVRTDETNRIDAAINALYQFSLDLKADGRNDDAETVEKLCEKLDHTRRAIVFSLLSEGDDNYLNTLYEGASGSYLAPMPDEQTDSEGNAIPVTRPQDAIDGAFVPDEALLSGIQDAMKNSSDSYSKHSSAELTDSESILGHLEYQYSQRVIENAGTSGADDPVRHLSYVYAISDSTVKNKDGELSELDTNLIPPGESAYRTSVLSGASAAYLSALSSGNSSASASAILEEQENDAESKRAELQFFIKEKTDRMAAADALKYTEERITWTSNLIPSVANDDFHSKAVNSLNAHIKWLRDLADSIKNSDDSLKSDLDALVEEKNDLLKDKLTCLDNNDLAGAAKIDKMLGVIDDKIKDEQKKLADAGKDSGGANGVADKLLSDALGAIGEEGPNSDSVKNIMGALGGIGATDQLNDLKNALSDAGANAGTMNAVDDAIADAKDSNLVNGSIGGSGYDIAGMSDEDLLKLLMSLLGKNSWNALTDAEKAIICAVLSELGDKGYNNCSRLAGTLGSSLYNDEHNKYIYPKYTGQSADTGAGIKWVSLKTVGDITDYRYVYNDSKSVAILSGPSTSYELVVGSDTMYQKDKTISIETVPVLQHSQVYEDMKITEAFFGVSCDYLGSSNYAVGITDAMEPRVNEVLNAMTGQS